MLHVLFLLPLCGLHVLCSLAHETRPELMPNSGMLSSYSIDDTFWVENFFGPFFFLVCPLVADGPHVTARGRTAWDWARDVRVVLNHIHNMGRRVLAFGHGGKEKSCFLTPTYGGLLSVGSQIRMYKFEGFRNAGSSFSDCNMLCYIGYIISCYISLYSVMFYHDFLKRIHCEITCLSRLQSTT